VRGHFERPGRRPGPRGGFGGTAQAYVPLDLLEEFKTRTEAVLGQGSCHVVTIRPVGGARLS
jgi:galactokinase